MSTKYTPAPWFVGDCEDSDYYIVCTELYKNLAMGQTIVKTHNEANAKLIAAAPELLEALQRLMRSDDNISGATDGELSIAAFSTENSHDLREQALSVLQARKAILKALGEQV